MHDDVRTGSLPRVINGQVCESQPVGEHGDAEALLDLNNVRAAVYNNGNFFWRRRDNANTVPKSGTANWKA